tara:strand:+ start:365 stop:577 length:213 start_codon:yes stop_codon:yes gene_type:complete
MIFKYFINLIIIFFITSCGYPDIDNVPEFNEINLNNEEIQDYCENIYGDENNDFKSVTECIIEYKKNNKL